MPPVRLACNGQAAIYPDADSPLDQLGNDDRDVMSVRIERPPFRTWTPQEHRLFPDVFRRAVHAFILCHQHLAAEEADSPRRVFTLGSLPVALRDVIIGRAAPKVAYWAPIRQPRPETPPVAPDDEQ